MLQGARDFPTPDVDALAAEALNTCGNMLERPGMMPTLWGVPGAGIPERRDFVPGPFFITGTTTAATAAEISLTGAATSSNWGMDPNLSKWVPKDGDFKLIVTRYRWHVVNAAEANLTGALLASFIQGLTWEHVPTGADTYVFPAVGYSRSLTRARAMELAVAANEVAPEVVEPTNSAWYNLAIPRPICPKTDTVWSINIPSVATNTFGWALELDGIAISNRAIKPTDPLFNEESAFRFAILARLVRLYGPSTARQIIRLLRK